MGSCEGGKQETKNRIIQAFWGLYRTTSIEKITVKNITDACGIYRTTFYLHFADVYAVLEMIESELMKEVRALGSEKGAGETPACQRKPQETMREVYEMLKRNYGYLSILLDEQRNPEFSQSYKAELALQICRICHVDQGRGSEKKEAVIKRTFSGIIDMMFDWAGSALLTFEEAAGIMEGYLQEGIFATLDRDMSDIF